ncbi:hypothetical protein CLF_113257, partial [Clonorchis sinensis]
MFVSTSEDRTDPSGKPSGSDLRPATGIVLSSSGKRMVTILDLDDLSCYRRHIDQVEFNTKGQSVNGTPAVSNTNESFVDDLMVSEQNVSEESEVSIPRRSERLRSRPPLDYKHPHAHSRGASRVRKDFSLQRGSPEASLNSEKCRRFRAFQMSYTAKEHTTNRF